MFILAFIIVFSYLVLVSVLYKGWQSLPLYSLGEKSDSDIFVSVVVCAHNEEDALPSLLDSLFCQTYPHFEVVVVDDHSTDGTDDVLRSRLCRMDNLRMVSSASRGKKCALREGVAVCRGSVILQTDADCVVPPRWVEAVAARFSMGDCDLLIGPVMMTAANGWESVQSLEFLSLVASGAGAAGIRHPILCNGANLAYTKDLWCQVAAHLRSDWVSGDDMFLLLEAKRRRARIVFFKSEEAIVKTSPSPTLGAFVHQRQRWSSKSVAYRDVEVISVAVCVMSMSLLPLVCLLSGKFVLFFVLVFLKTLIDFPFLRKAALFFSLQDLLRKVPFVEFFYPFYVVFCGVSGWFRKKSW
ncbi:MAG: glycosyltransferase [Prevotellaceae bacterium]|nr:glycosyltransferase [Prevotellaceae bacterium]